MRRTILFTAIAALFLVSCKKENKVPVKNSQKLYKVTFKAGSNFSQTIHGVNGGKQTNSLATNSDTVGISGYTTILYVKVYDANGDTVRRYIQYAATQSNYGTIVDSLPPGTYTAIMAAGQDNMRLSTLSGQTNVINYQPQTVHRIYGQWGDSFFSKFQFTVTDGAVNENVFLNRVDGKLEADFTDVIPANVARVDMYLDKEDFYYYTSTGTPTLLDTITYHFTVPAAAIGTNTYSISNVVLNTTTPFNVVITAYDSSNTVLYTHVVSGVTCQANQRTILSGNLAVQSGPGFNIAVIPTWGTPSIVHF